MVVGGLHKLVEAELELASELDEVERDEVELDELGARGRLSRGRRLW